MYTCPYNGFIYVRLDPVTSANPISCVVIYDDLSHDLLTLFNSSTVYSTTDSLYVPKGMKIKFSRIIGADTLIKAQFIGLQL